MKNINVTRSSMPDFDEYCEEIKPLWESRWLTNMGVKHQELQKKLEQYLDSEHVTLFTNGHLALEYILSAYNFPRNSEVITTPFTFVSTTSSIVRSGLVPVFCDVKNDDYTIDPEKIEALITDKTVAIMPVHVYGNVCDVERIQEIAKKHNLKVIYDAAHAFGVRYKGKGVVSYGDVSMLSFHATKVFNTIEGGALCYSDDSLVSVLDALKNFGVSGSDCIYAGGNAKMSEFHASMGICNLRHVEEEIAKRKKAVLRYRKRLSNVDGIKLCSEQPNVEENYSYFPVIFDGYKYSRDEVFDKLQQNGITTRKYFYPLTNQFSCYDEYSKRTKTPVAEYLVNRVLTLPLFADLEESDVDRICDIILN